MPNRLELPDELQKLIEKRESPDRRTKKDDAPPTNAAPSQAEAAPTDNRTGSDRRSGG